MRNNHPTENRIQQASFIQFCPLHHHHLHYLNHHAHYFLFLATLPPMCHLDTPQVPMDVHELQLLLLSLLVFAMSYRHREEYHAYVNGVEEVQLRSAVCLLASSAAPSVL